MAQNTFEPVLMHHPEHDIDQLFSTPTDVLNARAMGWVVVEDDQAEEPTAASEQAPESAQEPAKRAPKPSGSTARTALPAVKETDA